MGNFSIRLTDDVEREIAEVVEENHQFENKTDFVRYAIKSTLSDFQELGESG